MAAADPGGVTGRFRAMGSDTIVVALGDARLISDARERIHQLERTWSRFLPDSDISTLNRSRGWVDVSSETVELIEHAFRCWSLTSGAFDPTILPSLVSSGYAQSMSEVAGETILDFRSTRVPAPGMGDIEIDAPAGRIRVPEGISFDPGGIGKGLAADIVSSELLESGADAAIVSIGGDVRVTGETPPGWIVEVESPFDPETTIAQLRLRDGAVCTSSVRAKTWVHHGEDMHHLIDPHTGHPVDSRIVSATVVAREAWLAECLCKAAVIAEPLQALALCESHGVEAILVDVDGVIWRTTGAERFAA